jgi:hypothetical protein
MSENDVGQYPGWKDMADYNHICKSYLAQCNSAVLTEGVPFPAGSKAKLQGQLLRGRPGVNKTPDQWFQIGVLQTPSKCTGEI